MRCTNFSTLFVIAVAILFVGNDRTDGQPPTAPTTPAVPTEKEKAAKLKIVPVLVIKPGEERELTLSTECTVGLTRGGGFNLMEIEGKGNSVGEAKIWKRDGVTIEVPDFAAGEKQAAAPEYKPLKDAGVNVFTVKVSAAKEAKPGVYNLHLVDQTCSGWCSTDFRVLVVAAKNSAATKTESTEKLVLKEHPPLPYPPGHGEYVELLVERLGIKYEMAKLPEGVTEFDFIKQVRRHNDDVEAKLKGKHGAKIFDELHEEARKRWLEKVKPAKP